MILLEPIREEEKGFLKEIYDENGRPSDKFVSMTLYYEDGHSRLLLNAVTSFKELNVSVTTDNDKKRLYDAFYAIWSDLDGGELTGGSGTFKSLDEDSLYARVDYRMTNQDNVGAFYIVLSEKYDTVISFMSYCTKESFDAVDSDIQQMLESITYSNEDSGDDNSKVVTNSSNKYGKFKAGNTSEYTSLGYMDYKVPECWVYDDKKSAEVQYKSNVFRFKDGESLLAVKGITPYDSYTMTTGTTYEKIKGQVINLYGAIKSENFKTINGRKWYIIVTPDYDSEGKSYHNEIYFALSKNNVNLYYFEAYVLNEKNSEKNEYIADSIEYILKSANLYKVDE